MEEDMLYDEDDGAQMLLDDEISLDGDAANNNTGTRSAVPRLVPWVEKYRPERVEDVSHQEEVVKALKKSIEVGSVPHLLFHGPPGTGKTTTVLALARALYGPDLYKSRILELNASDERGIKVVREKIKTFAQAAVGNQRSADYPCPRFKLIILDEADTMTPEAQSALRRIIENYSKVTRFCLICNYVTRIIEPLGSRCAKFRFKLLPPVSMKQRIREIADKESVSVNDETLDALLSTAQGDMRKAVTFLQSCHQLSGGAPITPAMVIDVSGKVPSDIMSKLWTAASGYAFDALKHTVEDIVYQGYPMGAVLSQLYDDLVEKKDISDINKALICEKIGEAENNLMDGSNELLQLMDVAAFIMRRLTDTPAAADSRSMSNH